MLGKKKTIQVSLSAFGLTQEHYQSGTYQLKEGAKVKTLLRRARTAGAAPPADLVYMIAGKRVEPSRKLSDGEDLKPITHTVQKNENLKILAFGYYGDEERWEKLYRLNKDRIKNPNMIFPGQELKVMGYDDRFDYQIETHVIKAGETLKSIAKQYLGDEDRWEEIMALNKKAIKNPNKIYRGQKIKVRNERAR